jgi:hypothetical protein
LFGGDNVTEAPAERLWGTVLGYVGFPATGLSMRRIAVNIAKLPGGYYTNIDLYQRLQNLG